MPSATRTTPHRKPRSTSGWSPERRAKHAAAMKQWKPWEKSTGPRTKQGKKRSSQNAAKPHLKYDPDRMIKRALAAQSRYLTEINRFIALEKFPYKNELLKKRIRNRHAALLRKGRRLTIELQTAYIYAKLYSEGLLNISNGRRVTSIGVTRRKDGLGAPARSQIQNPFIVAMKNDITRRFPVEISIKAQQRLTFSAIQGSPHGQIICDHGTDIRARTFNKVANHPPSRHHQNAIGVDGDAQRVAALDQSKKASHCGGALHQGPRLYPSETDTCMQLEPSVGMLGHGHSQIGMCAHDTAGSGIGFEHKECGHIKHRRKLKDATSLCQYT